MFPVVARATVPGSSPPGHAKADARSSSARGFAWKRTRCRFPPMERAKRATRSSRSPGRPSRATRWRSMLPAPGRYAMASGRRTAPLGLRVEQRDAERTAAGDGYGAAACGHGSRIRGSDFQRLFPRRGFYAVDHRPHCRASENRSAAESHSAARVSPIAAPHLEASVCAIAPRRVFVMLAVHPTS